MDKIFYLTFIFPGFLIFSLLKVLLKGFGKKADIFDKTLFSLFFDIPIFIISILMLKWKFVIKIFKHINSNFTGIKRINDLKIYFVSNISMLMLLILLIIIVAIMVTIIFYFLRLILEKVNNKFRDYKIFQYENVWESSFVQVASAIPVEIFKCNDKDYLIARGFIEETVASLDEDIEFKIIDTKFFEECKDLGLLDEIDHIYYNFNKNIKIIVYKEDKIDKFLEEQVLSRR